MPYRCAQKFGVRRRAAVVRPSPTSDRAHHRVDDFDELKRCVGHRRSKPARPHTCAFCSGTCVMMIEQLPLGTPPILDPYVKSSHSCGTTSIFLSPVASPGATTPTAETEVMMNEEQAAAHVHGSPSSAVPPVDTSDADEPAWPSRIAPSS